MRFGIGKLQLVAVGFACVSGLAACSGSASVSLGGAQVGQSDVESTVAQQLAASTHQPVPKVSCPSGLDAKVGASIDCTLTPQGSTETLPVHVTVDSVTNGTAHYSAQVGQAANGGDKTTFCSDNAKLDQATTGAQQPSDLVPIFKQNQSLLDDFEAEAPADIIGDASTLANAAKAAISSGDASAFASQSLIDAGNKVDAYCGQNSDGSPATDSTTDAAS